MSIEKVKATLQKAKNYQVLAINKAKQNIDATISAALEQFKDEVDPDKLKAAIVDAVETQLASADLYSHQAEYELSEMVTEYDATIADLNSSFTKLEAELSKQTLSAQQASDTITALEAKVADLTNDLVATKSDLAATTEQKETANKQALSYKQQYEAVIATPAEPIAQLPTTQLPPPPAPGEEEDEPTEAATASEKIVALYNKLTAQSQKKKALNPA